MGAPNQTGCDFTLEDFCQSTVHVHIEWRGVSTEYTDHAKKNSLSDFKTVIGRVLFLLTTDVKMRKLSFDVDSQHNCAHGGREAPVYVSCHRGNLLVLRNQFLR